jgi:hypothetical protein
VSASQHCLPISFLARPKIYTRTHTYTYSKYLRTFYSQFAFKFMLFSKHLVCCCFRLACGRPGKRLVLHRNSARKFFFLFPALLLQRNLLIFHFLAKNFLDEKRRILNRTSNVQKNFHYAQISQEILLAVPLFILRSLRLACQVRELDGYNFLLPYLYPPSSSS